MSLIFFLKKCKILYNSKYQYVTDNTIKRKGEIKREK